MQNPADTDKQCRVNAFPFEDGINVGSFATKFLGEPRDGTLLPMQFRFDKLADVYHIVTIKKAEPFVTYLILRYRQAPCNLISTNGSRPKEREPLRLILRLLQIGGFQNRE